MLLFFELEVNSNEENTVLQQIDCSKFKNWLHKKLIEIGMGTLKLSLKLRNQIMMIWKNFCLLFGLCEESYMLPTKPLITLYCHCQNQQ